MTYTYSKNIPAPQPSPPTEHERNAQEEAPPTTTQGLLMRSDHIRTRTESP